MSSVSSNFVLSTVCTHRSQASTAAGVTLEPASVSAVVQYRVASMSAFARAERHAASIPRFASSVVAAPIAAVSAAMSAVASGLVIEPQSRTRTRFASVIAFDGAAHER